MFTQLDSIKYVNNFLERIKAKGLHIKHAFLYGSYSRGNPNKHSDIDLALVADEFTGFGFNDIKLIVRELAEFYIIQVKNYSTEYFEKGDPFINEILKTGIEMKIN